jgi:hypothetical protein
MSIGALSLGKKFDGVLASSLIDNRPFSVTIGWCARGPTSSGRHAQI